MGSWSKAEYHGCSVYHDTERKEFPALDSQLKILFSPMQNAVGICGYPRGSYHGPENASL